MLRCLPYSQAAPDFLPPQYWQFGFPFVHRQRNLGFDDLIISDDANHSVTLVVVGYPLCLIFALDIVLLGHLDLSCQFTHSVPQYGKECGQLLSWIPIMVHYQNIKDFKYESISKFWRGKEMNWHLEHQVFFTHEGERDSALSGVTLLRIELFVTLMKITMIIIAMVTGNSAGWLPECRGVNSHVPPDFWNGRQRRFSWRQRRRPRSCLWSRCRSWRWSSRILHMSLPLSSQRMQQFKVQSSFL